MKQKMKFKDFECPVCGKAMGLKREDISSNSETGQKYNRKVYWCRKDDTWGNLEIPIYGK